VEGARTPIRDKTGQNLQRRQPGVGQKIASSQRGHAAHSSQRAIYSECPPLHAGMAELADAADSKSAGPCGHGGSTPPPGTKQNKELRLNWPLKNGDAKIIWWLF
jgi:hypothetical protein